MRGSASPLREQRVTAAHAFWLGALLALAALAPAIVPYGGRYVTRGDFIEQQLPMILETRRILRGGLNSYSFATFLGAPAVGSYAFYTLGSPFVWPLALLPVAWIPYGISVMAVCKHAVCAAASFAYFRRMVHNGRLALLGCVLYTFSSFTVVNTQFYHFTEAVAFFPLLLLGIENVMRGEAKPGALALACGLNALTNYYFMLASALLAMLYFVCRFFASEWRSGHRVRRTVMTVWECGLGCGLAGVLLLPALHFMFSITRTGAGAGLPLSYSLSVLLERLRVLLMPIESHVVHAYDGSAGSWCSTACYLPAFGLTGAAAFVCHRGNGQRWLKALLGVLLVCSAVPALCGVFVLMTNVSYTRWWYGLALALTLATLYALRPDPAEQADVLIPRRAVPPMRRTFVALTALVCALTLPFLLPDAWLEAGARGESGLIARAAQMLRNRRVGAYGADVFRVLSLSLAVLGGAAMLGLLLYRPRFAVSMALIGAVAATQYGAFIAVNDRALRSGSETPGQGIYTLAEIAEPTLEALTLPPLTGQRIDHGGKLRNYGLLRGASSLTSFFSLRSSTVGRFVSLAGFGYDESTTVRPANDDPAMRALLSVSAYHAVDDSAIPEGFVYDHDEGRFAVYRNENAVPMGFVQTVCTGTHDQRMDADTVGQVMLAAVTLDGEAMEAYGSRMQRLDVHAIPDWRQSVERLRANACDRFTVRADGFDAHIDAGQAGMLVFTIPYDRGFTARVDGQPTEIVLCDAAFMGLWIEPGAHEITFTYRTRSLVPGVALSAAAALTLAVYALWMGRKGKAKRT